jgi:hypothetical protein
MARGFYDIRRFPVCAVQEMFRAEMHAGSVFHGNLLKCLPAGGLQGKYNKLSIAQVKIIYFPQLAHTTCITVLNAMNRSPHLSKAFFDSAGANISMYRW